MKIAGKTFVVTGANSGLGAGVLERLASDGAKVVGLDVNTDNARAFAERFGDKVLLVKADVALADQGKSAIETATSTFGTLNGLVNCAGIGPGERIVGRNGPHDLDLFTRTLSVNLVGTFNMMRLAAEVMQKCDANEDGERGVIVNTASIAAYDGQIGQAAYSASKGGVVSLTLPAARELARSGIRVMTIAPGIFETPMLAGLPQDVQDSLSAQVPFPHRLGRAAEFADLVISIVGNPMLNGEVIRLDGALRMDVK